MVKASYLLLILFAATTVLADHPNAYIVSPVAGAVVESPVNIVFGLRSGCQRYQGDHQ